MAFLMIDGTGNPNTALEYQQAIEALYGVAYTLKFHIKKHVGLDYTVMPLEGLWWVPDMHAFASKRKEDWYWTMMIAQPEEVTIADFDQARDDVQAKKTLPALAKLRLERFHEGAAVQIMYYGPFANEGPTIDKLHAYAREHGYTFNGIDQKHHEIYLSDPRRAAPEKLRTVLRQPVCPAAQEETP